MHILSDFVQFFSEGSKCLENMIWIFPHFFLIFKSFLGVQTSRDSHFSFNSYFGVQASRKPIFEFSRTFFKFSRIFLLFFGGPNAQRFSVFIQLFFRGPDVQRVLLKRIWIFPHIFKVSRIYQLFFRGPNVQRFSLFIQLFFSGSRRPETLLITTRFIGIHSFLKLGDSCFACELYSTWKCAMRYGRSASMVSEAVR